MAEVMQTIFLTPPIAIARLGGSTAPQDAYIWVQSPNPRSSGETTIAPDWSLTVQADGTVEPVKPTALQFRDGALIRPVCPFFELWAFVGEPGSAPATWKEVPVTPALLTQHGATLNDLIFRIDAKNFKAARRTSNPELRYGTFPPLEVRADNHTPIPILASSPPEVPAARRLIPANRNIPLGSFQVMKSRPQPTPDPNHEWTQVVDGSPVVNVEVIRFRYTPARGHCYGPPQAAQPQTLPGGVALTPVEASRAFLNQNAGWAGFDAESNPFDPPQDTYDGADVGSNQSLGVVDDTCEAHIEVRLPLPAPMNKTLTAAATVFVGPPDFAPDRRPFLSVADELNDRAGDSAARTAAMSGEERDAWVQDLFERIYETLSLLNLDLWRRAKAITLTGSQLAPTAIPNDHTRTPERALGGRDMLRNRLFPLPAESQNIRLPLTEHARMRHRVLADLENLRDFIAQNPGRLATLVRRAFEAESGESPEGIGNTTMRMPPFMRNSNAGPLTLAVWQYDLLIAWVREIETPSAPPSPVAVVAPPAPRPLSDAAIQRRAEVMERLAARGQPKNQSGGQDNDTSGSDTRR
jgi:hypothetical protein